MTGWHSCTHASTPVVIESCVLPVSHLHCRVMSECLADQCATKLFVSTPHTA